MKTKEQIEAIVKAKNAYKKLQELSQEESLK